MRAPSSSEIAGLDRAAADTYGIPLTTLMEHAGRRSAQAALVVLGRRPGRVAVLAGKGNNGGDGFVAGRILRDLDIPVTAVLVSPAADYSGEAGRTLAEALAAGVEVRAASEVALG